jgi:hypothetical protein
MQPVPAVEPGVEGLGPLPSDVPLLFMLRGEASLTTNTIRVNTRVVEWFSDRPSRQAGFASLHTLAQAWNDLGFSDDPPNAVIVGNGVDAVVELTSIRATLRTVTFGYALVRGNTPSGADGEMSIFIDSGSDCSWTPSSFGGTISVTQSGGGFSMSCKDMQTVGDALFNVISNNLGNASLRITGVNVYGKTTWDCQVQAEPDEFTSAACQADAPINGKQSPTLSFKDSTTVNPMITD